MAAEIPAIPRIHGFELLMASYAMCHMKLDMILTGLGYKPSGNPPRLGVYLTNSLEEGERVDQTLFGLSRAIAEEAKAASDIKRQTPIMCVIGNPPYSGISQNNGEWITGLIEDYKYVDGVHFGERKHWLQDDYVKFIRFAESMIAKNGEGVLGFITNHGYLDNPTFRGMRWHLMNTFDRIYVLDLHGNSKKKEVAPDGSADKNVFDIQQGVAIIVAVKKQRDDKQPKQMAEVRHGDLWGAREQKYAALWEGTRENLIPSVSASKAPSYLMAPREEEMELSFQQGVLLSDLFATRVTGIQTSRDHLVVDFDREGVVSKIERFIGPGKSDSEVRAEFFSGKKVGNYAPGDSRGWVLPDARAALQSANWRADVRSFDYRPFDNRKILYRVEMVDWPRQKVMRNFDRANLGLAIGRQGQVVGAMSWNLVFAHKDISDLNLFYRGGGMSCPLYLYPDEQDLDQSIRVNFDPKLYAKIRAAAGLTGKVAAPDSAMVESGAFRDLTGDARPDEVKVFDYIYGVLHCPAYRETYAEFLKIDFPRVPFPPTPQVFRTISAQGEGLRRLHLMEDAAIGPAPYPFHGDGDSVVDKPRYEIGRVYINGKGTEGQYFDNVPSVSWGFPIGGYHPAQKWLKDRKGRALSWDDIRHYQKVIKILAETDRIMRGIELSLD